MKIQQLFGPASFARVAFLAAAVLSCAPLPASAAPIPGPSPGEVKFWVTSIGVLPHDQLTYRVSYTVAGGARRESVQKALGQGEPLFKIIDAPYDFQIEAIRNPGTSREQKVEYRCSRVPVFRVAISFSSLRSSGGC